MRYRELDSESAIFEWMGGENYKFNRCHNSVSNFLLGNSRQRKDKCKSPNLD